MKKAAEGFWSLDHFHGTEDTAKVGNNHTPQRTGPSDSS
jgi:hypothetical protein